MGYSVYESQKYLDRFAGYGVIAWCDFPGCEKVIDRGLAYSCGNNPLEFCGKHFCPGHMYDFPTIFDEAGLEEFLESEEASYTWPRCPKCAGEDPDRTDYPMKPEHPDWIAHVATDPSWAQFRQENPQWQDHWTRRPFWYERENTK